MFGGEDEDLKPSAEDLEILAEIDRDMCERQARIERGESPVDPMVHNIFYYNVMWYIYLFHFKIVRMITLKFYIYLFKFK